MLSAQRRAFGGEARFLVVASPAYLKGRETPHRPHDLHSHTCIRFRLGTVMYRRG